MLCSGTFQHHLIHGSLNYVEAANVDEVARKYKLCREARKVLNSEAYLDYFNSRVPQLDRSVITFRKIENHYAACPELVTGARGLPVSTVIASYEARILEETRRARAADTQGVWGAPPQFAAGLREVKAEAREGSSSSEAGEISGSPDSPTPLLEGPEPPSRSPLADMLPEDSEPLVPPSLSGMTRPRLQMCATQRRSSR